MNIRFPFFPRPWSRFLRGKTARRPLPLPGMLYAALRRIPAAVAAGLFAVAGMAGVYVAQPALLRQLDNKMYDGFLTAGPRGEPSPVPVIVDIDERSLAACGQWPWPRYQLARLLERLADAGAASVALDILLAEEDRSSPVRLREAMRRDFGLDVEFARVPPELEDNDVLLARVLEETPAVVGSFMRFGGQAADASPAHGNPLAGNGQRTARAAPPPDERVPGLGLAEQIPPGSPSPLRDILTAQGALWPLPLFVGAAPVGAINVAPDEDGLIRSVPLLFRLGDAVYANLSLRALMRGMDVDTLVLVSGPDGLERIRVGGFSFPVSPSGAMQVPFRGPRGVYPYFSAVDVLEGRVSEDDIQGRIVFVGTSAAGLQDIRATPFDAVYPGVEAHAAVVDAVLSDRHLVAPPWTPGAQVLAVLLVGTLAVLGFSFTRPAVSLPAGLALAGCVLAASARLFRAGLFLSPVYAILTVGVAALAVLAVRFWGEERQKRVLRQAFSRYVAPEVVARIAERGVDVFAGEEREVTLLFTDVRGFTSLSETLRPEQVVALLNRYFTPMTACIRSSGGTLDKFMGDAIMAFWNAPLDVTGHPERAVRAALRMRTTLAELQPALRAEFGVSLAVGTGLHTGPVYVGNMGSEELLDYTCIGDTVNLASRLESLSGRYGVDIVCSGQTARDWPPDLIFRRLDTIRVKGRSLPVDIGTVLAAGEARARREELEQSEEALDLYRRGAFGGARALFEGLAARHPENGRLYALYGERCRTLAACPPRAWDGIWTFDSK